MKPQTGELAEVNPLPRRAPCPICGDPDVAVVTRYHARLLDYHQDKRSPYKKWCDGSDFVLSNEAQR